MIVPSLIFISLHIFTARKRSLGQGNIFAPVCHSVHRRGAWAGTPLGRYTPPGRYTPWEGTPPWQVHPPRQVHHPLAGTCPQAGTPPTPDRYTPGQVYPLTGTSPSGRYTPQQVHPLAGTPPWQVHPSSSACWEIRATSGRYASYWNAFLYYLLTKNSSGPISTTIEVGFCWHMNCN